MHKSKPVNQPEPQHLCQVQPAGGIYLVSLGWPMSANVYYGFKGRSKQGRIWRDTTKDQIWSCLGSQVNGWKKPEPLIGRIGVWWEIWMPDDNRKRDVDNFTGKHCLDVLVKACLMEDDSNVVEEHKYHRGKWGSGLVLVTVAEI